MPSLGSDRCNVQHGPAVPLRLDGLKESLESLLHLAARCLQWRGYHCGARGSRHVVVGVGVKRAPLQHSLHSVCRRASAFAPL
eukprot:5818513-Lingulodinium_polyedra.AAC.1